jgi:hypothetical protein
LIYLLLGIIAVLFLPSICFRLVNGPAYKQGANEVVIREPGARFLGPPQPVAPEARRDLEFAWSSGVTQKRPMRVTSKPANENEARGR